MSQDPPDTHAVEAKMAELWTLQTISEIADWIETNSTLIFDYYRLKINKYIDLSIREQFAIRVDNLHIASKNVVAWGATSIPSTYQPDRFGPFRTPSVVPGWDGSTVFAINSIEPYINFSDIGHLLRLYPKDGSVDENGVYQYRIKMFDDDWLGLANHIIMAKLAGDPPPSFFYTKS